MRCRTSVFAVLLFFTLAPVLLLGCILFLSGQVGEGLGNQQQGIVIALSLLVVLAFVLLAAVASEKLCRRLSAASPHPAATDSLTGLLTRAAAEGETRAVLTQKAAPSCSALILAELQAFRTVNEQLGHAEGDRLLQALAEALRGLFPAPYIAGRTGHDAFLLFVPGLSPSEAEGVLTQHLSALAERWPQLLPVGIPPPEAPRLILAAAWATHGATFEALYTGADRTLLRCRRGTAPFLLQRLP